VDVTREINIKSKYSKGFRKILTHSIFELVKETSDLEAGFKIRLLKNRLKFWIVFLFLHDTQMVLQAT